MNNPAQARDLSKPLHFGLIGYPVEHSLSPAIHGSALAALGMIGEYRLIPVPPGAEGEPVLQGLMADLRSGALDGLNVTVPHKQAVIELVDDLRPAARLVGAANTLYRVDDRLVGENTDLGGLRADLDRLGWLAPRGLPVALILGAGGAARAAAVVLAEAGWQAAVAARRFTQAAELAAELGTKLGYKIQALRLSAAGLAPLLADTGLVLNATPAGMWPKVGNNPWPADLPLPSAAAVYDLVYNPPETELLRAVRRSGLPAANGLGMLVEQAALSFECWTGSTAPREAMRRAVHIP